jgi:hypothetical protein
MMIKIRSIASIIAFVAVANLSPAFSQRKAELVITDRAQKPLSIDGQLDDWTDSLTLYNETTRLYYRLANDDQNIYLALQSASSEDLTKIFAGGISFSANIEGKKKDHPTVTFPLPHRVTGGSRNPRERPGLEEMQKQVLSRIRDIKVSGFKEIIDGGISLQNTYGIKAAAAFDKNNNLITEIAIPLALLDLDISQTDPVTYKIRINGLQSPVSRVQGGSNAMRQPRGNMYGSPFPPRNNPMNHLLRPTEFYIKSSLAKR